MNYLNSISKIFYLKIRDDIVISKLYSLSQKSIIATVFLSLLLTYYLCPVLSYTIVVWAAAVILVSGVRLYLAYDFQKNQQKHTISTWYSIFVFFTYITAFLFSMLGFISLFYVDDVHQIFIIAVMIGFTSGAMSSLFADVRILIGYISIILLPLIATLIVLSTTTHLVLALLVILYFVMQIIIILNSYK